MSGLCVCYRQLSTALMPLNSTVANAFNLRLNFQFAFTLLAGSDTKPQTKPIANHSKPKTMAIAELEPEHVCVNRLYPLWSMAMPSASRFFCNTAANYSQAASLYCFPSLDILLVCLFYFLYIYFLDIFLYISRADRNTYARRQLWLLPVTSALEFRPARNGN